MVLAASVTYVLCGPTCSTDAVSVDVEEGLYKSLQDEGEALNALEIARAARIELGRKLKELVIDGGSKK